jgi:hypothetical protein
MANYLLALDGQKDNLLVDGIRFGLLQVGATRIAANGQKLARLSGLVLPELVRVYHPEYFS